MIAVSISKTAQLVIVVIVEVTISITTDTSSGTDCNELASISNDITSDAVLPFQIN